MKLLLDVGNSRLKWATWDGAALSPGTPLDHAGDLPAQLEQAWRNVGAIEGAWIACVAKPEWERVLAAAIARRFGVAARFARSAASACGVTSAYAMPEKLGVDRFLALIALHAQGHAGVVLASIGTAMTLDALAPEGRHLGGLIAPSPTLMQAALLGATARVTASDNAAIVDLARDTEAAVRSGCWLSSVALIERFHAKASAALGADPALVLSGGGGATMGDLLRLPARYEADLVLRGLAHFADRAQ